MLTAAALKLFLGPLVGLLGSAFQSWNARKEKELDHKERALERTHELLVMEKESENALKKTVIESDVALKKTELDAFAASYEFANRPMLPVGGKLTGWHKSLAVLSDSLASLLRPGATIFYQCSMLGILVYCLVQMNRLAVPMIDAEFGKELVREIAYSVITLAETTLLWWFGIRTMSTRGKK